MRVKAENRMVTKVGNEQPKEWTEIKHSPTFNLDYSANIMFEFKNNKK
jgi:hypothetical protein